MTGMQQILTKIREMAEACYEGAEDQIKIPRNYKNLTQSNPQPSPQKQIPQVIIKQYLTALDYLEQYIMEIKECKTQYQHLEESLQKQQLQIRKHIGIEQQLRLYSESIKLQLEDCEKQKLQLLENSKTTIKAIKLKNQQLFQQLTQLQQILPPPSNPQKHPENPSQQHKPSEKHKPFQKNKPSEKHKPSSHLKTKPHDKSLSHSADHRDSTLNKIIKTEYIEREKHPFINLNIRKQLKYKNDSQHDKKQHKHHQSTHLRESEPQSSLSKKKHKGQLEKVKKEKTKSTIQSKQFDLGTYLSKKQLKKSPNKQIDKVSGKHQSSKQNEKHQKSSFQQRSEMHSKPQTEQKRKGEKWNQQMGDLSRQKSGSKEKKKGKGKEGKEKRKEVKKVVQHNRSLFSISSVEYRSGGRQNS